MTLIASSAFGVMIASLFGPIHECSHATAFRNRRLGDFFGVILAGLGFFVPYFYFREFHFEHHRKTHIKGDPEPIWDFPTTVSGLFTFYAKLFLFHGLSLRVSWMRACFGKNIDFVPTHKRALVITEAWLLTAWMIFLVTLFALISLKALALFFWVMFISGLALEIHTVCEHSGLPKDGTVFDRTRTMYSNALWRTLMWNETYHSEHHAYPAVPFFSLPKLHITLKPHLTHFEKGYFAVHAKLIHDVFTGSRRSASIKPSHPEKV
jgi:fatty acid desaturase